MTRELVERAISARVTERARKRTERTDSNDMDEYMEKRLPRKMALRDDGGDQQKTEGLVRGDMEE